MHKRRDANGLMASVSSSSIKAWVTPSWLVCNYPFHQCLKSASIQGKTGLKVRNLSVLEHVRTRWCESGLLWVQMCIPHSYLGRIVLKKVLWITGLSLVLFTSFVSPILAVKRVKQVIYCSFKIPGLEWQCMSVLRCDTGLGGDLRHLLYETLFEVDSFHNQFAGPPCFPQAANGPKAWYCEDANEWWNAGFPSLTLAFSFKSSERCKLQTFSCSVGP